MTTPQMHTRLPDAQAPRQIIQVVDDHGMLRLGLRAMAQAWQPQRFAWIESGNMQEALQDYANGGQVDLVLLDLNLPDSQGLQSVRRFLSEFAGARLAVFSATEDAFVIRQALAMGAVGFVPKSAPAQHTLSLICELLAPWQAASNSKEGPADVAFEQRANEFAWRVRDTTSIVPTEKLNATQLRVLELLLAGMTNQEIAQATSLALGTVKNTVSSTMLALEVRSRSHLISMFR